MTAQETCSNMIDPDKTTLPPTARVGKARKKKREPLTGEQRKAAGIRKLVGSERTARRTRHHGRNCVYEAVRPSALPAVLDNLRAELAALGRADNGGAE